MQVEAKEQSYCIKSKKAADTIDLLNSLLCLAQNGNTETELKLIVSKITPLLQEEGQSFQNVLYVLQIVLSKQKIPLSSILTFVQTLSRRLMDHFNKLAQRIQKQPLLQQKMLFTLSFIAEIIRQEPKFQFPLTKKFLRQLFTIDSELLQQCESKSQILKILGIIYHHLSKQFAALKKCGFELELKNAILSNYFLIAQISTIQIFNNTIFNLINKGMPFTTIELQQYSVLTTISQFITGRELHLFVSKIKHVLQNRSSTMIVEL